ncbi:hypothetical protein ARZXY2_1774 [Arthrobacter sp. ZXY-2]|nr:hypothetical protein ARZXY2_1774 [Arthrobacter sp. ZXY-2]
MTVILSDGLRRRGLSACSASWRPSGVSLSGRVCSVPAGIELDQG